MCAIGQAARERSRWPLWNRHEFVREDGFRSLYAAALDRELVVHDLFLQPILEGDLDLGGVKVGAFLEALEVRGDGRPAHMLMALEG